MSDNVVYLNRPREIAQFMRVGFLEHVRIEHLLSAGKLSARRFVIEAANFERQAALIRSLKDENAEIVLDTNAAELSTKGRFSSSVKAAPWAVENRPLDPMDFIPGTNRSVIDPIARFAVENKVTAVMAPSHFLGDEQDHWLDVDRRSCEELRIALDRLGGDHIAIDYPLIVSYGQFRDPKFQMKVLTALKDVPFDYLWLRVTSFGADATAAGIERYIRAMFVFHRLGRPVIADQLGGMASLAVSAFGASSGFAHGAEGKERFSASGWINPRKKKGGGRGGKTIYLEGIDRRLPVVEARQLFKDARTSREIFGCPDRTCCGDIDTMLNNPEAHFVVQKGRQIHALSRIPETLRADRFLTDHLEDARRKADRATRLKKGDDKIKAKITKASKRLDRVQETLETLHETVGSAPFAGEANLRAGRGGGGSGGREELGYE